MTNSEEKFEWKRMTGLGTQAISFLYYSLWTSFNTLAIDCPDLKVLSSEEKMGQSPNIFFSHTDPDHFDTQSNLEWRHPVYMHPLSNLIWEHLRQSTKKAGKNGLTNYTNLQEFREGVTMSVPGIGDITPFPFSHGTFLYAFLVESGRDKVSLVVPDSAYGKFTLNSVEQIYKRLDEKGKIVNLLIADAKNYGAKEKLTVKDQWERLMSLLYQSSGVPDPTVSQCPTIIYIKRGHVIQLLDWFYHGLFDLEKKLSAGNGSLSEIERLVRNQIIRKKIHPRIFIEPRLRALLSGDNLGRFREEYARMNELSENLESVDQITGCAGSIYITDDPADQIRYQTPHVYAESARNGDSRKSTEFAGSVRWIGRSGHDAEVLKLLISTFRPEHFAITHTGENGYRDEIEAECGPMVLARLNATHQV